MKNRSLEWQLVVIVSFALTAFGLRRAEPQCADTPHLDLTAR